MLREEESWGGGLCVVFLFSFLLRGELIGGVRSINGLNRLGCTTRPVWQAGALLVIGLSSATRPLVITFA